MTTVDRLYNEALELSEQEQEELLSRLAEHVEFELLRTDRAWVSEMRRRATRISTGEDSVVPGEAVLERMRARTRTQQ